MMPPMDLDPSIFERHEILFRRPLLKLFAIPLSIMVISAFWLLWTLITL